MGDSIVWVVIFIEFVDDRKHRGENASRIEGTFVFSSGKLAQEHVNRRLKKFVKDEYDDNTGYGSQHDDFFDEEGDFNEEDYDLYEVYKDMNVGQHVPMRFDYEIRRSVIE